ncbi:hypothetical protein BBJ28_00003427 [Nothophytophthora sp. Chile5]|nr:hypothetical protein BBJ28_00003427 [Nothophytophthora sp. Chile5]
MGKLRTDGAVEVEFYVRLLGEHDDHMVCLLGSAAELGAWDVEKAVPMEIMSREDGEAKWFVSVVFATPDTPLEYKYVVKHKQTLELISWEGLPGDRTLTIAKGTNVALNAPSGQSSTYASSRMPAPGAREAALGNNGNTNGFQEWRCCRTNKEVDPWWEVDLGKEYSISSIHLWKAMTYHEQSRHPEGRPPVTSTSSTSSPAPPLWVFISKEPLSRDANSLVDTQAKAALDASLLRATEIERSFDTRVETLSFTHPESLREGDNPDPVDPTTPTADRAAVVGRFVRLQCASASSALHFAELEVLTQDSVASAGEKQAPEENHSFFQHDDGFYGIANALDADLHQYVESGWLNPAANMSELQLWIGSFDATKPAIQWLNDEATHDSVAIEMRHEALTKDSTQVKPQDDSVPSPKKQRVGIESVAAWESVSVESKSAALLDKESTELRQLLEAWQLQDRADISGYLNNDPSGDAAETGFTSPRKTSAGKTPPWLSKLAFSRLLKPSKCNLLADKVATRSYSKGETLLSYGEQKRAVFYVASGEVELFGPESSTGANLLGLLSNETFFNEMGLFSHWPKQPASFKAKEEVTCQVLDFETLLTVLGDDKVDEIRDHYIRESHKPSLPSGTEGTNERHTSKQSAKPVIEKDATSVHYTDATHAQVFRVKVPTVMVDGSGGAGSGLTRRLTLGVYDCQREGEFGNYSKKELLGSAYLAPSQIGKHGEGDVTLPIFASGIGNEARHSIVGQITLTYQVLKPFTHPKNNLANVWRSYWRERPPLNIGHRGMGRSYYQVSGFRLALTRENTLASFILAGRSGADFVEFDVQLTKDRVPVIYHDFLLNVGLEDKRAGAFGTKPETYEIGIHDMTMRQLTQSYSEPVPHGGNKGKVLQTRVKKHWARLRGDKKNGSPPTTAVTRDAEETSEEDHLVDFFPRLEDLLKHVPAEVGLNVEIKYPDNFFRATMRNSWTFAMNEYIDRILQCVFDHAGSRRIFFSCFDPSICILLRAKQARYPVLFLTFGSMAPHAIDARMTLQFAVDVVKMEKLQGIVSNSNAFLDTPGLAPLVKKDMQAVLMTWGDQNTSHESVQLQKRRGIDAVISDNTIDLINQDKKLQALAQPSH